jgi:hypothetical protein
VNDLIKSDFELMVSKENLNEFLKSLENLETDSSFMELSPRKQEILRNAIIGEINSLNDQIKEYEEIVNSQELSFNLINPTELPLMLIKARIYYRLSHSDLADMLGISTKEFEELEDNLFAEADPRIILQLIEKLNIRVPTVIPELMRKSPNQIISNLKKTIGGLILKVIPLELRENENITYGHLKLATSLIRLFGQYSNSIISGERPNYDSLTSVRYKVPQGVNADVIYLYTTYAYHIAQQITKIIDIPKRELTTDPLKFRQEVIKKYGNLNLKNCINHIWDLGIPVIPIDLKGGFHGACWRIEGRNVIVLKQQSKSESKWLFDLLHEYWHATQDPFSSERDKVDIYDVLSSKNEDPEEIDANNFANNVLFNGKGQELLGQCILLSRGGKPPLLKGVVRRVAIQNEIDVSSLANFVAYSVSKTGKNFWAHAQNLQIPGNPYNVALESLDKRISTKDIDDIVEKEIIEYELNLA